MAPAVPHDPFAATSAPSSQLATGAKMPGCALLHYRQNARQRNAFCDSHSCLAYSSGHVSSLLVIAKVPWQTCKSWAGVAITYLSRCFADPATVPSTCPAACHFGVLEAPFWDLFGHQWTDRETGRMHFLICLVIQGSTDSSPGTRGAAGPGFYCALWSRAGVIYVSNAICQFFSTSQSAS